MVASALGYSNNARIVNIPLDTETESAYAIYNGDRLSKLAIVNMQAFNQTSTGARPSKEYNFRVPDRSRTSAKVERLIAPGSDATDGVTFGGVSYDHDLGKGRPVVVGRREEAVFIKNGVLSVGVPDSSAVVVSLT